MVIVPALPPGKRFLLRPLDLEILTPILTCASGTGRPLRQAATSPLTLDLHNPPIGRRSRTPLSPLTNSGHVTANSVDFPVAPLEADTSETVPRALGARPPPAPRRVSDLYGSSSSLPHPRRNVPDGRVGSSRGPVLTSPLVWCPKISESFLEWRILCGNHDAYVFDSVSLQLRNRSRLSFKDCRPNEIFGPET